MMSTYRATAGTIAIALIVVGSSLHADPNATGFDNKTDPKTGKGTMGTNPNTGGAAPGDAQRMKSIQDSIAAQKAQAAAEAASRAAAARAAAQQAAAAKAAAAKPKPAQGSK